MIFETYEMITPKKCSMVEYEQFYYSYGQTVKMNLLVNQVLKEIKEKIPVYFLEITENIEKKESEIDAYLTAMGLRRIDGERKQYRKSIGNDDRVFIRNYFNSDLAQYIDFYTNRQLIISLHAVFESSLTEYIQRKCRVKARIRQGDLIEKLFSVIGVSVFLNKFIEIHKLDISEDKFIKIWKYYTSIRNLYAHTGGIISKYFKEDMNGCSSDLREFVKENLIMECSLYKIPNDDFFQLSGIKVGGLFRISEVNYRFFNHFIVYIWETIYLLETQIDNTVIPNIFEITENKFEFKLYNSQEDHLLMQTMPETLTEGLHNFHINRYKCPNCNQESMFLYKATPEKDFDVSLIVNDTSNEKYNARKIFTCPNCKSFYFSLYGGYLSDNKGFNILEINDTDYLKLLRKFNNV
jgi:hypothetical protein